jgi:outer membrane protein assembly factor BamB
VVAGSLLIVASLSGKVSALTLDGSVRWTVELGERIYGSPLVSGDLVHVGVDKGKLVTLQASNGAVRARLDVDGDADTAPAPLPGGGAVFAAGKTLYALKPDGAVRFRYKLRRKVFSSPAVADDGAIAFGCQDDALHVLSPTGDERFRLPLGADVDASPSIGDDGTIYVGSDEGEVVAVRPDGSRRWRQQVGGYVRGPLSVARDGAVLASTYGPAPAVVALDPGDGHELFRFGVRGTGAREFGIHGAPIEDAEGTLIFGAQDDRIYALSPDGKLVWKLEVGGDVDAAIVLAADGVLYAGSEDGKLYAVRE